MTATHQQRTSRWPPDPTSYAYRKQEIAPKGVGPLITRLARRLWPRPNRVSRRYLQGRFSREFNRRWGRTGPLWQSRYKARVIDEPGYLSRVIQYIHLNPVRAHLAEDPSRYSFSGHRELMGTVKNPLCDVDEALLCFGPKVKSAQRSYASSIRHVMKEDGMGDEVEVGRLPWWGRDRELDLEDGRAYIDVLGRSTGLERPRLEPSQFVEMASQLLDVELSQLVSKRQDSETARLRRLIASCGIERWGQRAGKLAEVLNKHSVVVSRWVSEGRKIRDAEREYSDAFEALDKALSEMAIRYQRGSVIEEEGRRDARTKP